jgi:hypothetical protein
MKLKIEDGALYADNIRFCLVGVGNGRPNLPTGRYEVTTQYATVHGKVLPDAIGLGWIGASYECDCVLGSVLGRNGVIPSQGSLGRLLALLEVAESNGRTVWLEVVN